MPPTRSLPSDTDVRTRPPLAIVADDLTGLQAIAGEFVKLGFRVRTFLSVQDVLLGDGLDVIGVDTHSRHLPRAQAVAVVREAVRRLRHQGITYFYKQCDSGLQGWPAAEIEAMAEAAGVQGVVYAPACPGLGRVTVQGRQVGPDGLDVDIGALWATQAACAPRHCAADDWPGHLAAGARGVWTVDAQTERELVALAAHAWAADDSARPARWLLAGSVGLADALASLWRTRWPSAGSRGVLVVAGSQQAQTRRQIEALRAQTDARIVPITAAADEDGDGATTASVLRDALASGRHAVLVPSAAEAAHGDGAYPYVGDPERRVLESKLLQVLQRLVGGPPQEWPGMAGVLVAGGATSELVIRQVLLARSLLPEAWLAPGVAAALAELPHGVRLPVVTKAGTWGDTDVARRAIQWIVERDLALRNQTDKEHHDQ